MRSRPDADKRQRVRSVFSLPLVLLFVAVIVVVGSRISGWSASTGISAFATVFLSIIVQATPFLVLGVLLSAAIVAFVPADLAQRALPRNRALAVPVAGAAGMLLPGCECASVPVANGLMRKGVPPAAALTFLLAAPAVNPIVLASTWVAFASLGAAMVVGWLWVLFGRTAWIRLPTQTEHTEGPRWLTFRHGVVHDFLHAGGYLIIGGLISAVINVVLPASWVDSLAEQVIIGVLALALLAVVMCICSEADAFVAASFTQFSPTAQLAFMVVGPMVDLKLVAMQAGIFGRDFAVRFAPTALVCAIIASVIVGSVLL
ncbi:MAG: permease [Actinobacteria bacterium]|nr:permease [Actinomycetota bacterium]